MKYFSMFSGVGGFELETRGNDSMSSIWTYEQRVQIVTEYICFINKEKFTIKSKEGIK